MSRLPELRRESLTREQALLFEAIATGPRGGAIALDGPFGVWMHSPAFGLAAQRLGRQVRYESALPQRLSELAILVCARRWRAGFEWSVHAPIAEKAGVAPDVIEAIRQGRAPPFALPDEAVVHDFSRALLETSRAPDEVYRRAAALLGETALVDLTGLLGYYTLVAFTLNAFEVEAEAPVDWD